MYLTVLLLACKPKEIADSDTAAPAVVESHPVATGSAGWDPVYVYVEREEPEEPVLEGGAGPIALTPLDANGGVYGWAPAETLVPGMYTLDGRGDLVMYEVLAYGQASAFDPALLVGTVWAIPEQPGLIVPLDDILWGQARNPRVEILGVEGAELRFRIVVDGGAEGQPCTFLEGTGAVDGAGAFTWDMSSLDVDIGMSTLHATSMWLHWGWLPDGTVAGGVEGGVTFDTRALDPALAIDPDTGDSDPSLDTAGALGATCELLQSLGEDCEVCESDGSAYCATIRIHAGVLQPSTESLATDLAECGVDVETGSAACDGADITCAASLLPFLGMGALVRRRRVMGTKPRSG